MVRSAVDKLFGSTDPKLVHMLLDTAHLEAGGADPLAVARKFAPRIKHVHLKDVRADIVNRTHEEGWSFAKAIEEGIFTVPGDGSLSRDSLPQILQVLADFGFQGWLVIEAEQDPAKANPLYYAKKRGRSCANTWGGEMSATAKREIYFSFFYVHGRFAAGRTKLYRDSDQTSQALAGWATTASICISPPSSDRRAFSSRSKAIVRLKEAFDKAGLKDVKFATNVGTTEFFDPTSPYKEQRDRALSYLKSRVDITSVLGGESTGSIMSGPFIYPYGVFPLTDLG